PPEVHLDLVHELRLRHKAPERAAGRAASVAVPLPRPPRRVPRDDVDELAAAAVTEAHDAVGLREQRVVATTPYVVARVEARAALADDDRPRGHELAAADLDPEPLCVGVPPVAG